MTSWFAMPAALIALLGASCGETSSLMATDAEAVREHVLAIEADLELAPGCDTVRLLYAYQINEYGQPGWQVAVQSATNPEVFRKLQAQFERRSGD